MGYSGYGEPTLGPTTRVRARAWSRKPPSAVGGGLQLERRLHRFNRSPYSSNQPVLAAASAVKMEAGRVQGPRALGKDVDPGGHSRQMHVTASGLQPLVEFICARVAAVHRCFDASLKDTFAEAPATRDESCCNTVISRPHKGHEQSLEPWRVLVAIGGIPGSGKSTLAVRLQAALNATARSMFCKCLLPGLSEPTLEMNSHEMPNAPVSSHPVGIVSIDGFHFTRAELDQWVYKLVVVLRTNSAIHIAPA